MDKNTPRSVCPKPIKYSYFVKFDEPANILVCPDKKMLKLSDLEDIDEESPFEKWIQERIKNKRN